MEKPEENILRGGLFKRFVEREMRDVRKKYGLKRVDIEIIYFLMRGGKDDTLVDIYHHLNANKGYISQTLDTLCKDGYLTAKHDENDRRYVHYTLTHMADPICDEVQQKWLIIHDTILEGVSDEEYKCFCRVSKKMKENMGKLL